MRILECLADKMQHIENEPSNSSSLLAWRLMPLHTFLRLMMRERNLMQLRYSIMVDITKTLQTVIAQVEKQKVNCVLHGACTARLR